MTPRLPEFDRPDPVPRPESVEEVAAWAGSEDMRRTVLVYAPSFWVLLPLAALGFLIWGTITDPGNGWTGNLFDGEQSGQPWNFWLVWVGVGIWLLVAVAVLVARLSALPVVHAENQWIFEHGVAHSVHRTSVDYDDGEASWPAYIALDHRLDARQAAQIRDAIEQRLAGQGLPPSGAKPISSATLFGAQAKGGYFILHLPDSQTAGETSKHRWMIITEPRDSDGEVIVTPVPPTKRLRKLRAKARQKAATRTGCSPCPAPARSCSRRSPCWGSGCSSDVPSPPSIARRALRASCSRRSTGIAGRRSGCAIAAMTARSTTQTSPTSSTTRGKSASFPEPEILRRVCRIGCIVFVAGVRPHLRSGTRKRTEHIMSTTLTVDFFCSLDGYGSAEGWPGYWGKEGPELIEDRVRTFAQDQVLVFGATTFRQFTKFVKLFDEPYYDSLDALPKLVFSSTLEEPLEWQNSTVIHEDAVTAIERLKRTTDVPLRSHGSISLNRALLAAGLVDRLEVMMFPAITGSSGYAALFQDGAEFDLDLLETTVLDGRTVKLVYAPHVHGAIPEGVGPQPRETAPE